MRRRWIWRCALVVAVGVVATALYWPTPSRQVSRPRAGRVLADRPAIVYSSRYDINLLGFDRGHPFDIHKYSRIYSRLVDDRLIDPKDIYVPAPIPMEQIRRVHSREFVRALGDPAIVAQWLEASGYVDKLPPRILDRMILRPFRCAAGGTVLAAKQAMRCGVAINIGGGFHHASPGAGGGFCVYADVPIAIRVLRAEGVAKRAMVIDLDAHQGNGTLMCFEGDDTVFTFDMHQRGIYPKSKLRANVDIALPSGVGDKDYLKMLSKQLPVAIDRANPDVVFYIAGCDTMSGDPLASLAMTEKGIVARDKMVLDACREQDLPVVMVLGGGYSPNAWHAQYRSIRRIISPRAPTD